MIVAVKPKTNSALQRGLNRFFFQSSLRNCINCVHCDDHFFVFISFPQFIYDLFHISLTYKNTPIWELESPHEEISQCHVSLKEKALHALFK